MNSGRMAFAQLLGFVPFGHFEHLVDKYQANRWTRDFTAWSHFICMTYAQFTGREGLRDLIACLNSQSVKHFFGNSLDAVKSQIWIAVCVYLIALIAHKEIGMGIKIYRTLVMGLIKQAPAGQNPSTRQQ